MTTQLKPDRYLDVLRADADRMAVLAGRDLDAVVPTCPGWTVRDALVHTGHVYQHKVANMRTQAKAEWPPTPAPERDEVAWFHAALDELVDELVTRGPDAPSYTWWPEDQTVGFWYRRMAQETAVHRYDVESAFDAGTPVADDLAEDGIDELLDRFLSGDWSESVSVEEWGDISPDAGAGQSIVVTTGTAAWRVTLHPDRIDVEADLAPGVTGDATVTGDPSELLLWLWGRRPDVAVTLDGDPAAISPLRGRLYIATQ
jgi:uncharacterized protein (TIGR03083 family)